MVQESHDAAGGFLPPYADFCLLRSCLLIRVQPLKGGGLDCNAVWSLNQTKLDDTLRATRSLVWELASGVVKSPQRCRVFVTNEVFLGAKDRPEQVSFGYSVPLNFSTSVPPRPPPPRPPPYPRAGEQFYPISRMDLASLSVNTTDLAHQCAALVCYARWCLMRCLKREESSLLPRSLTPVSEVALTIGGRQDGTAARAHPV